MSSKKDKNSALVPRLRFPDFRDMGAWENKPMAKLYSFKGTNSLSRDKLNYERGSVKNIHYGDIHTKFPSHFDIQNESVPYINPSELPKNVDSGNYCAERDIIFADASEDMDDVGKSIEIVRLNGERLLSGLHTILARPNDSNLILGFGGHLFKSPKIRDEIKREAQGAKVLGISANRLSKIKICYPSSKQEQQRIADCLTSLDERIMAEAARIDALKAHKKGLLQQLFPTNGETTPRLRFPEFRDMGAWKERKLGKLGRFIGGGTPRKSVSDYWEGDIPWISSSDIEDDNIEKIQITRFINKVAVSDSATKIVPKESILFVSRVGTGKLAINHVELCTSQDFTNFIPDTIKPFFVGYYFLSKKDTLSSLGQGTSIKGFSKEALSRFVIGVPCREEQSRIADCLTSLDERITAEGQKLHALKAHKKGLMQQLFPAMDEVLG